MAIIHTYNLKRLTCPGCGAPLKLEGSQSIITCIYCGCDAKVERFLRKIEPDLPIPSPPESKTDKDKPYDTWSAEHLIAEIMKEEDLEKKIVMAKALDEWPHANEESARWIPVIVEIMLKAEPELDMALAGILGKLICHDEIKVKQKVILAGEKYGFNVNGSKGLLFALSLGDESTVKLLLDISEYAYRNNARDYGDYALIGVQTAIGRISDRENLKIAMEILLYRLFYVSAEVQDWILRFLWCHFDVGYSFMYGTVLELIDECVEDGSELVPKLKKAIEKCSSAKDKKEYNERLEIIKSLKTKEAKEIGNKSLGYLPYEG